MIDRADFIAAVRGLIGTPVGHRGRLAGCKLDCIGVPMEALAACGFVVPEPSPYPLIPSGGSMRAELERYAVQVPLAEAAPGDLVIMMWKGEARHVGVLVADSLIVHARAKSGAVIEEPLSRGHRAVAAWRLRMVG